MDSKSINSKNISPTYNHNHKKCGAVTCINNVQGTCSFKKCDLYENVLIQED